MNFIEFVILMAVQKRRCPAPMRAPDTFGGYTNFVLNICLRKNLFEGVPVKCSTC